MTIRVLLCPPLFFAQRRKWVSFVINGFLYAVCLLGIALGLFGLIVGAENTATFLFDGALFWLLCFAHVADARRREKARPRPPVPLRSRLLESALIVAVPAVMAAGVALESRVADPWTVEVSRITEALWEASWIVEQAQQYQRLEGRNAGSIAELRQRFPEAGIVARDPWSRDWIVSPAFEDATTPPNPGDLWVCSRGPTGEGRCPPENLGAVPSPASGSIGYSARFGRWQGGEERGWPKRLGDFLSIVLIVAPLPGYIASRVIRRVRGRPVPALGTVSGTIIVVVIVGILAWIALPMYATMASRARLAKAQADIRIISTAIAQYRAHMGAPPAKLDDLALHLVNQQGQAAGPFLTTIPLSPTYDQYPYRRWSDGRYLLKWSDPGGRFAPVLSEKSEVVATATLSSPEPPKSDDGAEMVLIPAGDFWMGSEEGDSEAFAMEKPRHRVYLDAYSIDKYEVTNAQYLRFLDATRWGPAPASCSDDQFNAATQPVVGVSWYGARAYCHWAGKRLPTEAEWEKAARGPDGRIYPWGNEWDPSKTNAGNGLGRTVPVGSYPRGASPYGVHDLAGNAEEWVADWEDWEYYRRSPGQNPTGPSTGGKKILRGGSWRSPRVSVSARSAARDSWWAGNILDSAGFRCARDAPR